MKKAVLLTLLLNFVLTNPIFANENKREKRGMGMMGMLEGLDLTKEQKQKLKEIRKESTGSNNRDKIKAMREELEKKFGSDAKNSELEALNAKIADAQSQQHKEMFAKLLKIRSILTVEQRKKFQEIQNSRKKKMRKKLQN